MDWKKYLKETDERKRWDMLQKSNRLSYDHVDDWIQSLLYFLKKEKKKLSPMQKWYAKNKEKQKTINSIDKIKEDKKCMK